MHSNGTLPLDAPLAARCGYSLRTNGYFVSYFNTSQRRIGCISIYHFWEKNVNCVCTIR